MGQMKEGSMLLIMQVLSLLLACLTREVTSQSQVRDLIHAENEILDAPGTSISAQGMFGCVLEAVPGVEIGGKAVCWGATEDPAISSPPRENIFVQIVTTINFACGVTLENEAICWGWQYGKSSQIEGLYIQLAGSSTYMCGILIDGNVNCWGKASLMPPAPDQYRHKFEQLACSNTHCAALEKSGHVISWDSKGFHHHDDHPEKRLKPPMVEMGVSYDPDFDFYADEFDEGGPDSGSGAEDEAEKNESQKINMAFKQITVSDTMTCGIKLEDSSLYCWGFIPHGGKPRPETFSSPGPYAQITTGRYGTCGLLEANNKLQCWGDVRGAYPNDETEWDQVSIGKYSLCAIDMESKPHCFSLNRAIRSVPDHVEAA